MQNKRQDIIAVRLNFHPYKLKGEAFILTNEGWRQLAAKRPDIFNWQIPGGSPGQDPTKTMFDGFAGIFREKVTCVILVGEYDKQPSQELGKICHEALHIVHFVFNRVGVEASLMNDEACAYLLESVFKQISEPYLKAAAMQTEPKKKNGNDLASTV